MIAENVTSVVIPGCGYFVAEESLMCCLRRS